MLGWGCGDPTAPPAPVATVTVTPAPPVDVVPGGTMQLSVVPKDATGNVLTNRITTWTSSDPAKVTVAAGLVTGVALGTATVTATVEGIAATVDVTVRDGGVATTSGASISAQSGAVTVLVPTGAVSQSTSITVTPAASPPSNPRLLAGSAFDLGPASVTFAQPVTITLKYDRTKITGGSPEAGLQLYEVVGTSWRIVAGSTVNPQTQTVSGNVTRLGTFAVLMQANVETVSVTGDLAPLPVTTTRQFTASLRDNEGLALNRPIVWTSSNPAVLTVDPTTGLVTARVPGTATITATSETKSGTASLTVVAGPAAKLIGNTGNGQSAAAGTAVASPPSVKVTDALDNPVAGVAVTFAVGTGGGTVTGASATTDAAGIARVGSWTLGTVAGPNTLIITAPAITGATLTFTASGGAGPAAVIAANTGNNQTGTAGGLVATAPSVKVTDANGNPVSGFSVTFVPGSGSGSVTGGTVATDGNGVATVGSWRLGVTPGPQTLVVSASGLSGSPVTFSATATAPVPSTIAGYAGNNQRARPGFAIPDPPSVIVTDPAGIPVPGVSVTFAVTAGGGTITGAVATTNASGIATVGSWTLGPTVGENLLSASVSGLTGSPVVFAATAVAAPPTAIAINGGDNQTAVAGSAVAVRPSVKVTDAEGTGVSGVSVTFSIRSGAGSITGASAVTNAQGIAAVGSWTLGIGGNSLFASVPGLANDPVIFVALGTAQVQIVTFGDSNTDLGFQETDPAVRVASYVSSANPAVKLAPGAPNSSLQLAGKIESRWRSQRTGTIKAVNHGISGTSTGAGRTLLGAPNALERVGGVTRFQGEALGVAYPWNGGEPVNDFFPNGSVARVEAFTPRPSDYVYISMGTNDIVEGTATTTIRNNLEIMIDETIARGLAPNRIMIATLPPRRPNESSRIPDLNSKIRTLAQAKGVRLIDISSFTSNGDGLTWKTVSMHLVNDEIHYAESVRDWIADQVVSIMFSTTPP